MHIIILGWLFVAFMLAVGESSIFAGVLSFLLWGILPIALMLYLFGRRRPRPEQQENLADDKHKSG